MAQQSGKTPEKDRDTRRWLKVFNPTEETIPAYGTFLVYGKMFTGDYTEKNLPDDKAPGFPFSWKELQAEVGPGNLVLVALEPQYGPGSKWFASYYLNGMVLHNGPSPIGPGQWGLGTRDYPTIAKVRLGDAPQAYAQLGRLFYHFFPSKSFELSANYSRYGAAYSGSYWGWGWGYGLGGQGKNSYRIVDMIDGFNTSEGLAWIEPGNVPSVATAWQIEAAALRPSNSFSAITEGENTVSLYAFVNGGNRTQGGGVLTLPAVEWLDFHTPGIYTIELVLNFAATPVQPEAGVNPYAGLVCSFIVESAQGLYEGWTGEDSDISLVAVRLAPPLIVQRDYPAFSDFVADYEQVTMRLSFAISYPDDFDPYMDADLDNPLMRLRLGISRQSNSPNMPIGLSITGKMTVISNADDANANIGNLRIPGA